MKCFFSVFFLFSFLFICIFGIDCFYGYLFPIKYENEVKVASERFSVEKALIYSVINVESGFRPNVVSKKGAVGLMQVLPSTAQELAEKLKLEKYDLKKPQDNILLGTYYLSILIDKFNNLDSALCAYNAGPANVSKWLQDEKLSENGFSLKEIPFYETREYLQKINKNLRYYNKKMQ